MVELQRGYKLIELLPGEKMLYVVRRHWFALVQIGFMSILVAFLPLLVYVMISSGAPEMLESFSGPVSLFIGIFYLFVLSFSTVAWMNYYFDIVIVTNRRLAEVEQVTLFNRSLQEVDLRRIEDITVRVKGFLPTLLGYGTVEIQTAGTERNFLFVQIPQPYLVAKNIAILQNQAKTRQHSSDKFD
jgi:hypothetical protein